MAVRSYALKRPTAVSNLRIRYDELLNPEQLAAVEAPAGPQLIIAGAGSGKTRTLTFRVARLIELGAPPESVLLLTFTNKAAAEMRRRVSDLIGDLVDTRKLLGGTFHHVAYALLRRHASTLGYSETFTLLDREDARDLMTECLADHSASSERRLPKAEVMVDFISIAANTGRSLEQVVAERRSPFVAMTDVLRQVAERFAARKRAMNAMDFDDLLSNLRALLREHPETREALAERLRCILVDEYQDTNRLQGDIIDLLAERHRNLTVVGDDAQSIYSFRGADFTNIIEFPARYPGCQMHTLTSNYRSTPEVLRLANLSIAHNRRQYRKELKSCREEGENPCLVPTRDADEQAAFVAQRLLELRNEGVPLSEAAVLYRAHHHSLELQVELGRRGIPFVVRSGTRFFEQAHIKDVVAHLRLVQNPADELAFKRVLRLQPAIGAVTAQNLWARTQLESDVTFATRLDRALEEAQLPKRAREALEGCARLFSRLELAGRPTEMIDEILEAGYAEHLRDEYVGGERRVEDIRHLAEYAARHQTLDALLSDITLLSELSAEEVIDGEPTDEYVTLSSVHQAKGLEWRAVFVIWLVEGRFPLAQAMRNPEEEEEERRLFYVAVTRAKDQLYLCYPRTVSLREGERALVHPSTFISELPGGDEAPYDQLVISPS